MATRFPPTKRASPWSGRSPTPNLTRQSCHCRGDDVPDDQVLPPRCLQPLPIFHRHNTPTRPHSIPMHHRLALTHPYLPRREPRVVRPTPNLHTPTSLLRRTRCKVRMSSSRPLNLQRPFFRQRRGWDGLSRYRMNRARCLRHQIVRLTFHRHQLCREGRLTDVLSQGDGALQSRRTSLI